MESQVDDFLAKLFEVSNFDPESVQGTNKSTFDSNLRVARDRVLAAQL